MASRTERTEGDTERKTGEESHPLHTSTRFKTLCGVSVWATTESSSQHTFVSLVATQLTLLRFKPQTKITEARNQGYSVFFTIRFCVLMMAAVSTSETSVNIYQTTWRKIPWDSHWHACRRENLKPQNELKFSNYYTWGGINSSYTCKSWGFTTMGSSECW